VGVLSEVLLHNVKQINMNWIMVLEFSIERPEGMKSCSEGIGLRSI
jgi:hypothetical protein